MDIIIWLFTGGLIGWVISLILVAKVPQGMLLNAVVGGVGAVVAALLIAPHINVSASHQGITNLSVIVSLLGAVTLLALLGLFQRRSQSEQ